MRRGSISISLGVGKKVPYNCQQQIRFKSSHTPHGLLQIRSRMKGEIAHTIYKRAKDHLGCKNPSKQT